MLKTRNAFVIAFLSTLAACASAPEPVKQKPAVVQQVVAPKPVVSEPTPADFKRSAQTLIAHLNKSGVLTTTNGEKGKIRVLRIVDTTKKFDTAQIRRDVQAAMRIMLKNAKVLSLTADAQEAADFFLSGRITSRIAHVRGKKRTEYYIYLTLSDARGINLWENDSAVVARTPAVKRPAQNQGQTKISK